MSNKKMIHVFNEMVVKAGRDVDTAELHFINGGVSATFFCAQQAHHAAHAINNHDRLVEENKQQRESLDAFRELVKAQTQTMNELNERCKESAGDNADLVKHLENLVDESIYLAQFKNKTLRGNIRSTDLDEPEWHDYQTIGEAVAFLEKLKVSK